jgi:hypothetical protein
MYNTLVILCVSAFTGIVFSALYVYRWIVTRRMQTVDNVVLSFTMLASKYMELERERMYYSSMP